MLAVGSRHTKVNVSSTSLFFLFCQYRDAKSKAVVFSKRALFCKVHYVALPCFYSSPVWTNQTLALEIGFCVFSNNCGGRFSRWMPLNPTHRTFKCMWDSLFQFLRLHGLEVLSRWTVLLCSSDRHNIQSVRLFL